MYKNEYEKSGMGNLSCAFWKEPAVLNIYCNNRVLLMPTLKNTWFTVIIYIFIIVIISGCGLRLHKEKTTQGSPVRIGYFHGGKAYALYRAYSNNYFSAEDVEVTLYSKFLDKRRWRRVPVKFKKLKLVNNWNGENRYFGKVSGMEIVKAIEKGIVDGGTVGEASFVAAVANNSSIVAVAMLGQGEETNRLGVIVVRNDVVIRKPEDFKGKTLITPRSGPFNYICLKKFIESIGLDPENDVTIIDQVPEDQLVSILEQKKADGGLYNLNMADRVAIRRVAYVYRKMDWVNPDLPHGLLVFRKDFVEAHPQEIEKIVRAYMKRLKYEKNNPQEKRTADENLGFNKTLYWREERSYPPLVSLDLLNEVQGLMRKYQTISTEVDLEKFINNDFVEEVYKELE